MNHFKTFAIHALLLFFFFFLVLRKNKFLKRATTYKQTVIAFRDTIYENVRLIKMKFYNCKW